MATQTNAELNNLRRDVAEIQKVVSKLPIRTAKGGGGTKIYKAPYKAGLPEVPAPALGYATAVGHFYVRTIEVIDEVDTYFWRCVSHTEADE